MTVRGSLLGVVVNICVERHNRAYIDAPPNHYLERPIDYRANQLIHFSPEVRVEHYYAMRLDWNLPQRTAKHDRPQPTRPLALCAKHKLWPKLSLADNTSA